MHIMHAYYVCITKPTSHLILTLTVYSQDTWDMLSVWYSSSSHNGFAVGG